MKWVTGIAKAPTNPPRTEGLTPLDQDRASSVADEGGTSAASVDAEPSELGGILPLPGRPLEKK